MRWLSLILTSAVLVATGCVGGRHAHHPPRPIMCPNCHHLCKLEVEQVKEERVCYDVECEAVCLPRVKLPWEDPCTPPKCAKTRLVHVLVEKDYECEKCHYKWTPVGCEECQPNEEASSE